jgi:hypothetical protein
VWPRIGTSGGALVNTVMNLLAPLNFGKFLIETLGMSTAKVIGSWNS